MTRNEAITFFEHLIPGNGISAEATRMAIEALKEKQAEIDRLKNDKANVIKLLEKEREENKPGSDYAIRPMRASDINEQHKGMYYAFSFAINALKEQDGEQE